MQDREGYGLLQTDSIMEEAFGKNPRVIIANWVLTMVSETYRHKLSFLSLGTLHLIFLQQYLSDGWKFLKKPECSSGKPWLPK